MNAAKAPKVVQEKRGYRLDEHPLARAGALKLARADAVGTFAKVLYWV
jgi:hypothetical protein